MTTTADALTSLHNKHSSIRDRIRGVALGRAKGFYLYGPPGTSKTFLVRTTLDGLGPEPVYANGHITARGLFDLIAKHPDSVIVIDDVNAIFKDKVALSILLAALGRQSGTSRASTVRYQRAGEDRVVEFRGGIIAISNEPLGRHDNHVVRALGDRVHVMQYAPTEEEIEAQILEIAATVPLGVSVADATTVAQFLLADCRHAGVRLSVRLFVDKAIPDFLQWQAEESESHWHDLVHAGVLESVIVPQEELRDMSRQDQIAGERRIAAHIHATICCRDERAFAWYQYTGKSESSLYRRLKELGLSNFTPPPPPPPSE